MEPRRLVDKSFLATHPAKRWVHDRVVELLASETSVPSFSIAAMKLTAMVKDDIYDLEDLAAVVRLDQGLSMRCLRVASGPTYGGHNLTSIQDAMFLMGMAEMRRVAFTVGVMDNFNHLRIKVNWQQFWLHSVLVARLTERIAGSFRDITGMEYLTGLMHDIGKLILEHYFPREFEAVILRALERKCGHAAAEFDLLGLDHTCIGAALCQCLNLHQHVAHAVRFHHHAAHPAHTGDPEGDGGFLACCVSVADTLANMGDVNIGGQKEIVQSLEELAEEKLKQINGAYAVLRAVKGITEKLPEYSVYASDGWKLLDVMSPSDVVTCANCSQKNRLPEKHRFLLARCGKCRGYLAWSVEQDQFFQALMRCGNTPQ